MNLLLAVAWHVAVEDYLQSNISNYLFESYISKEKLDQLQQVFMAFSNPSSTDPSRVPTPNPTPASRFTSQNSTAEDLLKSQTVGLVHLNDFRKRRAEALEQKERETQGTNFSRFTSASNSGITTPNDGYVCCVKQPNKKTGLTVKAQDIDAPQTG
ncbi:MAG: hypothetical protein Q9190_005139 [Brigantiaea leucoxantha]